MCSVEMAELHFFMTYDDTRSFVAFLVRRFDAHFYLDQGPSRDPPVFDSVAAVQAAVESDGFPPRFFIENTYAEAATHLSASKQESPVRGLCDRRCKNIVLAFGYVRETGILGLALSS